MLNKTNIFYAAKETKNLVSMLDKYSNIFFKMPFVFIIVFIYMTVLPHLVSLEVNES